MPRLLAYLPCEKIIIDSDNNVSLISVLQDLKVQVPEAGPVPGPAVTAAMKWQILTMWLIDPGDVGKFYEEKVALFDPDGAPTAVKGSVGNETTGAGHRNVVTVLGFPIGKEGRHSLRLWMYERGNDPGEPIAEYPIRVSHDILKK